LLSFLLSGTISHEAERSQEVIEMQDLIHRLTESARRFGISTHSEIFADAMNTGAEALEAGHSMDVAFDLARGVLRDSSTLGRCERALTAV
jgi:hypothetical protein